MTSGTSERVQFIRLGYEVAMEFRTTPATFEEFEEMVHSIGNYNDFRPTRVIDAVRSFWDEVSGVEVGREYSPVIYVELPYWTNQQHGNRGQREENNRRLTDHERMLIEKKVLDAFKRARADENDVETSGYRIRAWWD